MHPFLPKSIRILFILVLLLATAPLPAASPAASAAALPPDLLRAVERLAPDALASVEQKVIQPGEALNYYGQGIALGDNMALIGGSREDIGGEPDVGHVYYFTRSAGVWSLQQILSAPDGDTNHKFGEVIELSGARAFISAPGAKVGSNFGQGAVYVFDLLSSEWTFSAKLTAADGAADDSFGTSLAYSDSRVLVGVPYDDVGLDENQGSAYIFAYSGGVWSEQDHLTATDGAAFDFFGNCVALFRDTALVGAPWDDVVHNVDQGSAYIFTRSGSTWTQQARLVATDGAAGDAFGYSTALNGSAAVVGAPWDSIGDISYQGSVYVFAGSGATWSQTSKLIDYGETNGAMFGWSLALTANTLVVGSPYAHGPNYNWGAAVLYTGSGAVWTSQAKIFREDGTMSDEFGSSVASYGDTLLVGAPDADAGSFSSTGAAYLFTQEDTAWVQQATLIPSMAQAGDVFGDSVAVDGEFAVIGACQSNVGANVNQGAAFVFMRSGGMWQPLQRLTAPDGAANDWFGYSVAISAGTLLIGAPEVELDGEASRGAVYVFTRMDDNAWEFQSKLMDAGGGAGDGFGQAVALDLETAAVGAPYHSTGAGVQPGAVYVFTRSGASWTPQAQLTPAGAADGDEFGHALALSGNTLAVGSPYMTDTIAEQGAVYVYTRDGTAWTEQTRLTAADGTAGAVLGYSVALDGETLLAGAPYTLVDGKDEAGAAYVFNRSGSTWSQPMRLTASEAQIADWFGHSLALDGNTMIIATFSDYSDITRQGAGYIFGRAGPLWLPLGKLTASDGLGGDQYGSGATLSGATALIGARGFSDAKGAAYFYEMDAQTYTILLPLALK